MSGKRPLDATAEKPAAKKPRFESKPDADRDVIASLTNLIKGIAVAAEVETYQVTPFVRGVHAALFEDAEDDSEVLKNAFSPEKRDKYVFELMEAFDQELNPDAAAQVTKDGEEGASEEGEGDDDEAEEIDDVEEGDEEDEEGEDEEEEEGSMFIEFTADDLKKEDKAEELYVLFCKDKDTERDGTKVVKELRAALEKLLSISKNGKVYKYSFSPLMDPAQMDELDEKDEEAKITRKIFEKMSQYMSDTNYPNSMNVTGFVTLSKNNNFVGFEASVPELPAEEEEDEE